MKFMTFYRVFNRVLFVIMALTGLATVSVSQRVITKTPADQRLAWYKQFEQMQETSLLKNLAWQFVGPTNISGRMTDVEVVTPKGRNYTIYVAGASGGVWKTLNEGITWEPVFEKAISTSIGDLALDPRNQQTLWVGTGEANIFRSSQAGGGIFCTHDGGKTWEHKGLAGTGTISRIIVHPRNSSVVYVAAGGNEWTDNRDRGVFKTIDGGKTWNKIHYIDEKTGAIDLVINPADPEILYVATWQRIRKKWNDPRNENDYSGSGIYKTTDGGKTWKPINKGLPEAKFRGRIGIDLCKSQPSVLYAFIDHYEKLPDNHGMNRQVDSYGRPSSGRIYGATVFRSEDAGESWKKVSEQNPYMEGLSGTYGWVFGQVRVDPVNPDKVYVMGLALNVSTNGGKTFRSIGEQHGDHHGLWIDPDNTGYMVNVNDGGVAVSYDGENFRTFYENLPLAQFFNVNYDMATPFRVYGSIQDHGSRRGVVDLSGGRNRIPAVDFENAPGGEGSNHAIDPDNPDIVYSAGFYGNISRTDMKTGKSERIMPPVPRGVDKLRGQWLAPFILSPHNPTIIYHGTQFVHRSMNGGRTWECISPDLTFNDPAKQGDIPYQTIFTLSESPLKFGLIYAGTDDGRLWVTRNSGEAWEEISKGLPEGKWMSRVVASQYKLETVYLTQNGKRDDDFDAYVWKSDDFGKTWVSIKSNIPCGPINVIREDPANENILYLGTDMGVFVSVNKGNSWINLPGKFPTTYVHDLVIHPRDQIMIAATHGRGIWAMDVKPIQELAKADLEKNCSILHPEFAMLPFSNERWYRNTAKPLSVGYFLGKPGEVGITVTDSTGIRIADLKGSGDRGLNFVLWNLTDSSEKLVSPGKYKLVIKGEAFSEEVAIEVRKYRNE